MATHSSTLAGKVPWMEEPGRLLSTGSLGVRHDWAASLSLFNFMHWKRKWQATPVFLPGESQGRESQVGCRLWGRTESDTTEATWQQRHWLEVALVRREETQREETTQDTPGKKVQVKVAQSCLTLCDPTDYTIHGIPQARILEQVAFPSPGNLPNPGIKPRSPTLQADSLLAEPQGIIHSRR